MVQNSEYFVFVIHYTKLKREIISSVRPPTLDLGGTKYFSHCPAGGVAVQATRWSTYRTSWNTDYRAGVVSLV